MVILSEAANMVILSEVFCKKRCSKKFCKIHRKTPVPESLFLIKLQAFIKKNNSVTGALLQ